MQHNEILISEIPGAKYTSTLEEGDYIPYFVHKYNSKKGDNNKLSIQNSAGKPNLFITIDICDESFYNKYYRTDINTYIICKDSEINKKHVINNVNLYKLFPSGKFILTNPNLKIIAINDKPISEIKRINYEPPIIIVPNVITNTMKDELINYYNNSDNKNIEFKGMKNRTHVFTNNDLTMRLDDKLSKSLFPELKKIYNIDITHRENYKICSYDSDYAGKFHAHRDSVYPYGHRRYAMSLILNDNYEGGGIIFPEYSNKPYKPEPCSALIFPTPLYHQVLEVKKGIRYVIVSFLFGDHEADYKRKFNENNDRGNNDYKIKVIRDQRNILVDDICPQ